jgi:hypothetical protein
LPPDVLRPGLFFGAEVSLVGPSLSNWTFQAGPPGTRLSNADLNWTVSPEFTLGYRFCRGNELLLAYQFLESSGNGVIDGVNVHSHANAQRFDVDYASAVFMPEECWRVQVQFGGRFARVRLNSEADDGVDTAAWSNLFNGGGPHLGVDVWRALGDRGLALFGKIDGGLLFGDGRQKFTFDGAPAEINGPELTPTLDLEAGLSWVVPGCRQHLRLDAGYRFEAWWFVPDGNNNDQAYFTHMNLLEHGPFIRGQLSF